MTSQLPYRAKNDKAVGHLAALFTILVWGTTFVSTKILLVDFSPIEILFIRFAMGLVALFLIAPKLLRWMGWRYERLFLLAGLFGVTLYYLLENIALTGTLATNVGVIVSVAPFFTAALERLVNKGKALSLQFAIGFIVAMVGICFISFSETGIRLSFSGDVLALCAALVWACYSVCMTRISALGVSTIKATRRVFEYGLLLMIPFLPLLGFAPDVAAFLNPINLGNLLFLGLGASAACFVTWNFSVKRLGSVVTSVYIYLVPVITAVASWIVLGERLVPLALCGVVLTIVGLFISQFSFVNRKSSVSKEG